MTPHAQGTLIRVKAQPQARKNAILGEREGALRVAVTAAPEKGKANEAVAEVIARALHCRANAVAIVSGETSREKRVLIVGLSPELLREKLATILGRELFRDDVS